MVPFYSALNKFFLSFGKLLSAKHRLHSVEAVMTTDSLWQDEHACKLMCEFFVKIFKCFTVKRSRQIYRPSPVLITSLFISPVLVT